MLRFTVHGKRREMGLGSYPTITLGMARESVASYRLAIVRGLDPIEERKTTTVKVPTFTQCAARYIRAHRHGWRNHRHARQWVRTMKTYARPILGQKPVDQVTTEDVLKVLESIWTTKAETAKRVQGRLENILDFAAARKYREATNPARWRGHLDKLLPKPSKVKQVIHHPAMPYTKVATFIST